VTKSFLRAFIDRHHSREKRISCHGFAPFMRTITEMPRAQPNKLLSTTPASFSGRYTSVSVLTGLVRLNSRIAPFHRTAGNFLV
jgi:hypothetical protein